jgi:hypothetical protein
MNEIEGLQAQINNLQIVVDKQTKEIEEQHKWILRAFNIKRAIAQPQLKKLRKIESYVKHIYDRLKEIDLDRLKRLETTFDKLSDLLYELNLY